MLLMPEINVKPCIIGIPVRNDCEFFKIAIHCIMNSTQFPFKLIIVESESTDGCLEFCDSLKDIYPGKDIEIIHTPKEGPLKAYNRLFEKAKEYQMDLYLTQTDVIHFLLFQRDWLYELYDIAQNDRVGLVAPLGAWGVAGKNYYEGITWAGGWSCYIPIKTINLIGGYDEGYEIGDGVDIDYSMNVMKNGYELGQANFWVQHHWLTEHENEQVEGLDEIKKRNGIYFRKKYKLGEFAVIEPADKII